MPKKLEIPQAVTRRTSGLNYNKLNDQNKAGADQRALNNVANTAGQTLTSEAIGRPFGWWYTFVTLCNMIPPLEHPEQQSVIKKNAPAFEATTRIDVRREGNQTRIHSFVSTSTINRKRIQSPLFLNTTDARAHPTSLVDLPFVSDSPLFDNQTFYHQASASKQQDFDVAKRAHELSIFFHQKVHELYQLANCSSTRRTDQVNTLIVTGESVEQTSFTTVCQEAFGRAEAQNKQEIENLPRSTDSTTYRTFQGTPHFSAEEAAQKLSKSFQAAYENKQNATGTDPTNLHNQVIETFWNGLTELFYQFFSQYEHTTYTQDQKETNGSLLSYFVDWLLSSFSVNYGAQIPNQRQSEKKLLVPMAALPTDNLFSTKTSQKKSKKKQENNPQELTSEMIPESVSKATPILSPEKESVLPQIWYLIEDFYGKVDEYIQLFNFDVFPQLGAEAMPIPSPPPSPPVMEPPLQFSEKVSNEAQEKLENTITLYMRGYSGNQLWKQMPENLPTFWYDSEIFEKRDKLEQVNREVNKFICSNIRKCPTMTGQELLLAVKDWKKERDLATVKTKRRQLANIILTSSGLPLRKLTDTRVAAILLQWQNNNIFKDYRFKNIEQTHTETTVALEVSQSSATVALKKSQPSITTELSSEKSSVQQRVTGSSISTTQPSNTYEKVYEENLKKFNSIISAFFEGESSQVSTSEILPAYFFEDAKEVYKKRHETLKVNDRVKKFLCEQKVPCEGLSILQLITATQGWIRKEGKEAEGARSKQVADTILSSLGLPNQEITEKQANAIFMQWRNNNIFKDFKLGDIPSHGGTPIKNSELVGTLTATRLHSYGVLSFEVASTMNEMHVAYFDKRPLTMSIHKPLIPFWYDFTLYQKRDKTEKANESVKQFLYKQQISSEILIAQQTVMAAHKWVNNKQTDADILEKQKKLAPFILEGYGIVGRNLSDTDVANTVLQWENNNIFSEYTFIELKQSSLNESQFRNETLTENSEMKVVPDTITDPDLELVHKAIEEIVNDVSPLTIPQESLPIFYYHFPLFQKRSETAAVNKKLNEFFTNEGIEIKDSSIHELEKGLLQWVEKEGKDKTEREQFLTYFILKAYGVEDIRLGEFLSSVKIQAIFKQWKVNTVLAGRTYKEITRETIHHQLSKAENPLMIHFKEQKKESDQIFADFIHDRPAKISKNHPVNTIYYNLDLFENREATPKVNTAVRTFLLGKKVSFSDQSTSELVRKLREWILEEPKYATIIEREKQIAQLLQKVYRLEEKEVAVKEVRYLLLQWENNNAQAGYTYKETSVSNGVDISQVEEDEEKREKIEAFTRENNAIRSIDIASEPREKRSPKLTEEQKENIRKNVVAFLATMKLDIDASKPNELVVKTAKWATMEVEGVETIDFIKVKALANIIMGKKAGEEIPEETAENVFKKWLYDTIEYEVPTVTITELPKEEIIPTTQETEPVQATEIAQTTQASQTTQTTQTTSLQPSASKQQKSKYEAPNWCDKNLMVQVAQFFRQEGTLTEATTKENILVAMGKWFTQEGVGMVLSYGKLQSLSKVILKELNLYGGTKKEKISDKDAKLTITKWVFENVLQSSIEVYMLKQILNSPDPSQFTIGNLRKIFETEALINFSTFKVSKEELTIVQKLWSLFLKETLPNYFLETSALADDLPISDYASLMQLTGARLLADAGILTEYNQTEIQSIGAFFLETISKNGVKKLGETRYILLPALLAIAQLNPELLRDALKKGNYQEVALQTFIGYWQNGYFKLMEHQGILYDLFKTYQKATLDWRRKQALAEVVAQKCLDAGLKSYTLHALTQNYLNGLGPCYNKFTPPDLDEWYTRLTKAVSDSFFPLDRKLVELALKALDLKERQFIFSIETELYEASAELEHVEYILPGTRIAPSVPTVLLTKFHLDQTDLFVAVRGDEERWYALKKLPREGGYAFYRVDQNPRLYLKYGLLDQKEWKQGYKIVGNVVQIGKRYFDFITRKDQNKKLPHGVEIQSLIDAFSRKHSDTLYEQLYRAGNDKSISDQVWDVAKHMIPFYDCVIGIIDQDVATAVPSCLIDIVLLIPVVGQITALNAKFALGMTRAIATGGIRNAIRQGGRFTPKFSEVKSLLTNIIRYFDPGFEEVADGSIFIIKNLVDLRSKPWVKDAMKKILEKTVNLVKETPPLPKDVSIARLPNGLEVPVKRMEDETRVIVTNIRTGDVYGYPFWLRGNQLEMFSDPVLFTKEQKTLINRLTKEINPDQIFVEETNMNPDAYGNGKVMSVIERGKETKYFIIMNGHTVPVRMTAIEEHGIRYDVVDEEKIFPVSFNGREWYFEGATSPSIPKELAEEVMEKIDEFEFLKDPTVLSPPYESLMWNALGRSYIKINDHYIPLIQLHKNKNRYHLVKKDAHQPMTVLILDPENRQFRLETSLPVYENLRLPEPKTFPDPPNRVEEWREIRNAIDIQKDREVARMLVNEVEIAENDNIPMSQMIDFIPESRPIILNDENFNRKNMFDEVVAVLPKEPALDFRVYGGFDFNKAPNFLKPFYLELAKDYMKAQNYYQKALELCQGLLAKERIAETSQGQYLIKMFKLQEEPNPEPTLLKIVNRLASIVKKGGEFLQKTADWGYENILVVSTELVKQGDSQQYLSSYKKDISTKASSFTYDPECRIIIYADAFHLDPTIVPTKQLRLSISQVIIHETTHVAAATEDLLKYWKSDIGVTKSAKMILAEYNKRQMEILKSKGFETFVKKIARNQNRPGLSRNTVWKEVKKNNILRINLQMIDAEMLMTIIRDFVEERDFEGVLRVTRSINDELLGDGLLFTFLPLTYTQDNDYLVKLPELDKTLEQTTDFPDITSTMNSPINGNRDKREAVSVTRAMEFTEDTVKQSFYDPVTNSIERNNNISQYGFNQQVSSGVTKTISKRSDLNLVITNTKNSHSKTQVTSGQQVGQVETQPTTNNSFSNLVFTSKRRSTAINSTVPNQQVNKNKKVLTPLTK